MITLWANTVRIDYKNINFSDTCSNVIVDDKVVPTHIVWNLTDLAKDMYQLALIVNAYKKLGITIPTLVLGYIPNARADRVFVVGNAFPLQVTADFINSLKFTEVCVADPHSSVSLNLINNLTVKSQLSCFLNAVQPNSVTSNVVICSPDKGALEKAGDIAFYLNVPLVRSNKIRDLGTGKITDTHLSNPEVVQGRNVIICDDICDGGGTFIPLAKKLKEAGAKEVSLYVTHGIFAKGLEPLSEYIDKIYVYNILPMYVTTFDIQKFNLRNN